MLVATKHGLREMGVGRTVQTLRLLNQQNGFDCPGCAWPDKQGHRGIAEFCENGVKAVAEEATKHRIGPDFFAKYSVAELANKTEYWLGKQGRLTQPMVLRPGASHYTPIEWNDAFRLIADQLNALPNKDDAIFYTSGRTSNEAAFLYQLFVRSFGTNNLPDCSNLCHESSGAALTQTIGVGKGSVSLTDITSADLILVVGQNPGTNHPRMLTALEEAKDSGAKIVVVNPLPEAGLIRFRNPQRLRGVVGSGTALADTFCQIRIGGDLAFFQALGSVLLLAEDTNPGTVLDWGFIQEHTHGFAEYANEIRKVDWDQIIEATGLSIQQIAEVGHMLIESKRTIICWAMGLTQHKKAVSTIRELVNVLLLRGMIGKPGAGVCPVRGHSNVQGDRTMGIHATPKKAFLDALEQEFTIPMPRNPGHDAVNSVRAMRDGSAKVFFGLGGNFVSASADTEVTEHALRSCALTVQVSTKLNRSHLMHGRTALILPTLGRTELDEQESGLQFVTVEDSMSVVHASQGRLRPASNQLLSEVAIVCRLANTVLGSKHPVPWLDFTKNYDRVRERIANVIPGFADYNSRVRNPDGFVLPHPPRDARQFPTATGKANFTVNQFEMLRIPENRVLLQTLRSHDQYNTTIYGLDDRYRGVRDGRRVVFMHPEDLRMFGVSDGQMVDLVSEWSADAQLVERRAKQFRAVSYPTAKGCAAAYFPEANALLPLDSVAETSNTPTAKAIVIRIEPASEGIQLGKDTSWGG